MKAAILVLSAFALMQTPSQAPVVSVRLTAQEIRDLDAVDKKVSDARAALEAAESERVSLQYSIRESHRASSKLGRPPSCVSPMGGYMTWGYPSGVPNGTSPEVKPEMGYNAKFDGDWIIFTLEPLPICHGV